MATIPGTPTDDILTGTADADEMSGFDGEDLLKGLAGVDFLVGGAGNDRLKGGAGDDTLLGGAGNDWLIGGEGFDTLDGGDGSDEYRITVKDAGLADGIQDTGDFGMDTLDASAMDVAQIASSFDAGTGIEIILGNEITGTVLQASGPVSWDFTDIRLSYISALAGSDAADVITGSDDDDLIKGQAGTDELNGRGGDDTLRGGTGADDLNGGTGNDVLKGGGGNDVLDGGVGDDRLVGGKGDDQLIYDAADTVSVNGGAGTDTLVVEGSGVSLDITDTSGVLYQGIEIIDLTGSGANTLTLDRASLRDLSGETNVLLVLGNGDDSIITVGGTWSYVDTIIGVDLAFDVYTSGELILQVEAGVDVTGVNTPGNDVPIAAPDGFNAGENSAIVTGSVLFNDHDPDGDTLSIISFDATSVAGASVSLHGNSGFIYGPRAVFNYLASGETTTDTFTYTVSDGQGSTDTGTVTVTITGVNDPVTADDDTVSVNEDATSGDLIATVLPGDTDPDVSDVLRVVSAGTATKGTVNFNNGAGAPGDETLTYTADGAMLDDLSAGETTTDTFTYTLSDGKGSTDIATVTVTITGVNDPITADDDAASVNEDATSGNLIATVLAGDTDPDTNDVLRVTAVGTASKGTVSFNAGTGAPGDETLTYTADGTELDAFAAGETTTDSFTYTVSDGQGSTDTATVTVTITGVNDPVTADDDAASVNEDAVSGDLLASLLAGDSDPDVSDVLRVVSAGTATKGTVNFNVGTGAPGDETLTYTADGGVLDALAAGETTTDTFTYTVSDGKASTDTATVTVTITGVNDPITADDDAASVNEDATNGDLIAAVLAGDTDPDVSDLLRVMAVGTATKGTVNFNAGTGAPGDETLTYTADGAVLDALAAGETTIDTFTYTVSDGQGSTDTATVTVTITGVNDPVTADDDAASVNEDATSGDLIATVLPGDTDPDVSDVLRVMSAGTASKGTVNFNAGTGAPGDETLTYTADGAVLDALAAGETTIDTFTYTVSDGQGSTDTATVTVTITGVNDPVTADDDTASVNEDATSGDLIAAVLTGDTDPDTSDVLRVVSVGTATKGTVHFNAGTGAPGDEALSYTADGAVLDALAVGETTTDTFTYTVSDGNGSTDTATVTVTITGVNDPVTADDDAAAVNEDATSGDLTAAILAGDSDPDSSDVLRVVSTGTATKGTVNFNAGTGAPGDETLTYTADGAVLDALASGETTTDTFTYTMSDGNGSTDTATVTVTITGVNDPVAGVDDNGTGFSTDEDNAFNTGNVLSNDQDIDGDILSIVAVDAASAAGASITYNLDGTFTYDPLDVFKLLDFGESAADTFTYTVTDGQGSTDIATVTILITGDDDLVIGIHDGGTGFATDESTAFTTGDVLVNDIDIGDDDTLSVVDADLVSAGGASISDNGDGTFGYDPNGQFENLSVGETITDTFTYLVSDGHGASDTSTVTVTITGVNDPVTADDDAASVNEDATSGDLIATVLAEDTDPDINDVLRVVSTGTATKGTVNFNVGTGAPGDETLTYTADGALLDALAAGETTTDTFTYTVSDGQGSTDTATVTVTITGVNDPVTADDDEASVNEDGTSGDLIATVLAGDTDPDSSDVLRVTAVGTASKGTVNFNAGTGAPGDETLTFTADGAVLDDLAAGETTTDTFTYTVSDGQGSTDTATVTVMITGVNDPVAADDDTASVNEDATSGDLIATVLAGDTDPDSSDVLRVVSAGIATKGTVNFNAGTGAPGDETLTYTADGAVLDALATGETTTDAFTYTVSDGQGSTDTATVTVTVTGVNDPMTADDDAASVNEDATSGDLIAAVLAGDTDPDTSDVLRVTAVGTASKGTVNFSAGTGAPGDETLTYTADGAVLDALAAGETTTDTFTYTVRDGNGSTDTATVTVTITGVNDPVTADDDTVPVNEDAASGDLIGTVLAGDTDPDTGDILRVIGTTNGGKGTVNFSAGTGAPGDETLTYTADGAVLDALAAGETTTDTFTYTVSDGQGSADTATVMVTITGVNDPVTADDDTVTLNEDAASGGLIGTVLAGDSDPDTTDNLRVIGTTNGGKGTVSFNAGTGAPGDETLTYTADGAVLDALATGETTTDTFTYTVSDSEGSTDTATLTVTITGVNDPVTADDDTTSVNEDATSGDLIAAVLTGDTDPDTSDVLRVTAVGTASKGTVSFNAGTGAPGDETLTYTADGAVLDALAAGETTIDTLTYTVSDGQGSTDTATVTVTITGVNDAPVIAGDLTATLALGGTYVLTTTDLAEADPDDSGAGLTYTVTSQSNGVVLVDGVEDTTFTAQDVTGGLVSFEHDGSGTSSAGFNFALADGGEDGATADTDTFSIAVVNGVNAPPMNTVPGTQSASLLQNLVIDGITIADPDIDGSPMMVTLSVDIGSLSLSQLTGLTFSAGDGSHDASVSFTGQLADVNAALDGLVFHATQAGEAVITLASNDQGATGTGGALGDTDTISVNISVEVKLSALDGRNGFQISGEAAGDTSGFAVSSAGDFNGDGFDDFIVGAKSADSNGANAGAAYLIFGVATGFNSEIQLSALDGGNGFQISGVTASDYAGFSVSSAGDINGDGYFDIVIGALRDDSGGTDAGAAYVVFGRTSELPSHIELSELDGADGFKLEGNSTMDLLGRTVSTAGDVNGDGFDDLILGAANSDANGTDSGAAYIVFGHEGPFAAVSSVSELDGNNGFRIVGASAGDLFGQSTSAAGDINGDGYGDVVISAGLADEYGAGYVIFGSNGGFESDLDLAELDGSNGFKIAGNVRSPVSTVGDINGDGFSDFAVSVDEILIIDYSQVWHQDSTYIVFGSNFFGTGELDLSNLDGTNGFQIYAGHLNYDFSFRMISSAAGDMNGDGFDDLIVGANFYSTPGTFSGAGYVIFGQEDDFDAEYVLSELSGLDSIYIPGVLAGDRLGSSVASAGDVNGDGFDDLIIGAYAADPNGSVSGASYVLFGGDSQGEVSVIGGSGDDTLTGDMGSNTLIGGLGNDILIGGGGNDVLIGAAGDDVLEYDPADTLRVDGGTGTDTLLLNGASGVSLDLTAPAEAVISGMEVIDLTGSGDNLLLIDANGLVQLTEGVHTLRVDGDAGDVVQTEDHWSNNGEVISGYTQYTQGAATLQVQNGVTFQENSPAVLAGDLVAELAEGEIYTLTVADLDESDPDDSGAELTYYVSAVANGTVELDGSTTTHFTAQDVIDGLVSFTHDGSETGTAGFDIALVDGGLPAAAGTFTLTVSAVNDSPVNTVPGGQTASFLENKVIAGISVADADAGSNPISITLSTDALSLSLSQVTGLTFTTGDGSDDASMTFTGMLTNVNAALNNLVFHATQVGEATITLTSNDQGNTGSGGALGDTDTLSVTVFANVELSALDGTNGFEINGEAAYDRSGVSVSQAGDVNGDGFADLIIGADQSDPNGNSLSGASYVVFGAASGFASELNLSTLNGSNGFQVNGEVAGDRSGSSVSLAGDVNGDGFDDLIIGAFRADPNGNSYSGASYVVFGAASGFASELNLSTLNGSNGFQLNGELANDNSGLSLSQAGDVNGDGLDDLIIGAYSADPNGNASGASYVVFGAASGFAAELNLSTLNGSNGFQVNGEVLGDQSGFPVSHAGDVNGDGFDDLIIGASSADPNGKLSSGASYVVFGAASGFASELNLSTLDGSNGFQLNGEVASDNSGYSVSAAGDVNGDGFDDLIIGAHRADPNGSISGASYVVFGAASGFASELNLSTLNGSNGFQLNGEAAFDRSGRSVSQAGDVNGDGFDDLIISAHLADPNGNTSGASYVVFGAASGFASEINLSTLNGSNGFQLNGEAVNDYSGISVSHAGDVNGDGFDDLIIGAHNADPNGSLSGASYVIFGADFREEVDFLGGADNENHTGDATAEILIGGLGNDTLSGAGGADVLSGGAGDDALSGDAGADKLRGGTGADILSGGDDADRLEGDNGADTLDGGLGNDVLTGGGGNDIFAFKDALGVSNIDTIMDFGGAGATALDVMHLDNAIFTALSDGALVASAFESGAGLTAAATTAGRIIYDMDSGALYYDVDGLGGVAAIQFAVIATAVDGMMAEDFLVI